MCAILPCFAPDILHFSIFREYLCLLQLVFSLHILCFAVQIMFTASELCCQKQGINIVYPVTGHLLKAIESLPFTL